MSITKASARELGRLGRCYTTLDSGVIKSIDNPVVLAVWVHLQSQSTEWKINTKEIMSRFGLGRDKARAVINELKKIGLIQEIFVRDDSGRIVEKELVCLALPIPDSRAPENQGVGHQKPEIQSFGDVDKNKQKQCDMSLSTEKCDTSHKPENRGPENREPKNQAFGHQKPENQSFGVEDEILLNHELNHRRPENQSPGVTESLKTRALNKRSKDLISDQVNKHRFDFSKGGQKEISGITEHRRRVQKDFLSGPKSADWSELGTAELYVWKRTGKVPMRLAGITDEQLTELKTKYGI